MKRREIIHPAAEAETEAARVWYANKSPTTAVRFIAEFNRVVESVFEYPLRHPEVEPGTRRALLRKFPYSVYYLVEPDLVMIVSVAHHKRRPGYWKRRLPRGK